MHEYILPQAAQLYHSKEAFKLELGGVLPEIQLAYHTYGELNAERNNVLWVCHALTANSDAADWWKGLIGEGCGIDTSRYFVVCVNVLGSYYGSTSARFINPETGEAYGKNFPRVTVRDIVRSFRLVYDALELKGVEMAIGGSFGGHQVLEMAFSGLPIRRLMLIACSARETAWSIAIHEAQRMIMETDPVFHKNAPRQDNQGIRAARALGLLNYRTLTAYLAQQTDENIDKTDDFKASSYMRYQGQKLDKRFHIHCYWHLTKILDTHNVGRGRGSIEAALQQMDIPTTVVAISSDALIPPSEQRFMAQHIPHASFFEIDSAYGHDGFLIEVEQVAQLIRGVLAGSLQEK